MSPAVAYLRRAVELLAQETLVIGDAVAALGTLVEDLGPMLQAVVRPSEPAFARADVARLPRTDDVADVELTLAADAVVSLEELSAAFGLGQDASGLHHGARSERLFMPIPATPAHAGCALFATLVGGRVTKLLLRRDPPL